MAAAPSASQASRSFVSCRHGNGAPQFHTQQVQPVSCVPTTGAEPFPPCGLVWPRLGLVTQDPHHVTPASRGDSSRRRRPQLHRGTHWTLTIPLAADICEAAGLHTHQPVTLHCRGPHARCSRVHRREDSTPTRQMVPETASAQHSRPCLPPGLVSSLAFEPLI